MSHSINPFDSFNFTIYKQDGVNPSAGASYAVSVPVNARSAIALVNFQLVSDANAANRQISAQHYRAGVTSVISHTAAPQIASKTLQYVWSSGLTMITIMPTVGVLIYLPDIPIFLEGDELRFIIDGIQVGDQLSNVRLYWKVWPYEQ